jgi:hypothetical protein
MIFQSACLALAVLTLLATVVVLSTYVIRSVGPAEEARGGEKDDPTRPARPVVIDLSRRYVQLEQRAAVIESCGLIAGVGVAFLAVSLILGAARVEYDENAPTLARLVPLVPGVVALIGAVVIIAVTAPQSRPTQQGAYPTPSYTVPQAFPTTTF